MAKTKTEYSGELVRPFRYIPPRPVGLTLAELLRGDPNAITRARAEEAQRVIDAQTDAIMKKLPALFRHYGLSDGDYARLVIRLAIAHVPGFSMGKAPPGAKLKWDNFNTALLRFHIDKTQEQRGTFFTEAAHSIARSTIWKSRLRASATKPGANLAKVKRTGETLRRRAMRADPELVKLINSAYCGLDLLTEPPTVEQFVRKCLDGS